MNKKGLSHVDWVMSFGIFVIFVLLLFIWFGPSLTTEFSNDYLGEIAVEGFKDASYHEVYDYPIFFEVADEELCGLIKVGGMSSLGIVDKNIFLVDDSGSSIVNLTIGGDFLTFEVTSVGSGQVYEYDMYVSDYFNNTHFNFTCARIDHNATIGIGERLYGFSERRFSNLSSFDYDVFKEELKYPLNKDVSVYVYDSVDFSTLLYSYNISEPLKEDNVYVVSWSDVLINESGGMEQITVLVKTW